MAHNGGTADCAETEGAAQLPCGSEVDRRARVAVAEPECDQDEPAQRRRAIELSPEVDEGEAEARRREGIAHPVELGRLLDRWRHRTLVFGLLGTQHRGTVFYCIYLSSWAASIEVHVDHCVAILATSSPVAVHSLRRRSNVSMGRDETFLHEELDNTNSQPRFSVC